MEWQPIDTAPRDGTRFLGWNKTHGMHECTLLLGCENHKRLEAVYGARTTWATPICFVPTHWMPLPEPPKGDNM